ncbi:Zinc/iron permease [Dissophora ornata]|nr:Zinc/iron permease [Dissophora ornata]
MIPALVDSSLLEGCQEETTDGTHYRLHLHIAGVLIILAASAVGVFMPLIAFRFHSLCISPRVLTLGKQFGTGVILATAFIHMMPTAMSNLSSPCLGPIFSENYSAFGGLCILSSSLFMHWIEFVAMEHNQERIKEAAIKRGMSALNVQIDADLGGLGATGVAAAPCPGHKVTIVDEAICRRSSCSSVSSCIQDHSSLSKYDDGDSSYRDAAQATSSLLHKASTPKHLRGMEVNKSYGSIPEESHLANAASPVILNVPMNMADHHHHHYQDIGHSHTHGLELLDDSQRKISTYILEAGVAFHSVIIGVSLGVSSGTEFMGLLIALAFHQFFEGFALGARIADLQFDRTYIHGLLALIFSLTTPVGAVIGIGISSSYNPTSALSILIEGMFDAISAGILLYMGYVNLLAVEFNMNGDIRKEGPKVKMMCFLALWAGAAVMAAIGCFA